MPHETSDADVVSRVLDGDPDAFGILVGRYQDEFTAYARYMTGSLDEAADVVQESFVRAYKSLRRCREPAKFKGWLFRIVSNQCKTHLTRRNRHRSESLSSAPMRALEADGTPHDDVEASELQRRVHLALEQLTDEQREAIVLKYLHGLSLTEMAELLSASVPALKMRLKRGRAALREQLEGVMV